MFDITCNTDASTAKNKDEYITTCLIHDTRNLKFGMAQIFSRASQNLFYRVNVLFNCQSMLIAKSIKVKKIQVYTM